MSSKFEQRKTGQTDDSGYLPAQAYWARRPGAGQPDCVANATPHGCGAISGGHDTDGRGKRRARAG